MNTITCAEAWDRSSKMSNLSHLVARALCKGKLRNLPATSGDAAVLDTRGLMIEREAVEESFRGRLAELHRNRIVRRICVRPIL